MFLQCCRVIFLCVVIFHSAFGTPSKNTNKGGNTSKEAMEAMQQTDQDAYLTSQNIYKKDFGDISVFVISLGNFDAPFDKLIASDEKQSALLQTMANDKGVNHHNVVLIKGKEFLALIDTGFNHTQETLIKQLQTIGISHTDITHIIISHAHPDHIGGILPQTSKLKQISNVKQAKNTNNIFRNAKLLIDEVEYNFWTHSNNELAKNSLHAFSEVEFFTHNAPILATKHTKIDAIKAYGHTPGHTIFSIESAKEKLIFISDLVHYFKIQNANPAIAIQYDNDKAQAVATREALWKKFKKDKSYKNALFVGAHFPTFRPITLK